MKRLYYTLGLILAIFLASCTSYGTPDKFASDAEVAKVRYISKEPPSLTLITMVHNKSGFGGHSALLIDGSERVMYDPAGRWWSSKVAERHDLVYGVTPAVMKSYRSFHARDTHHVVSQKIYVSHEVAERAIAAAQAQGRSADAACAVNTIAILQQLPGFEDVGRTLFPAKLMKNFAELEGVTTDKYYETDKGKN